MKNHNTEMNKENYAMVDGEKVPLSDLTSKIIKETGQGVPTVWKSDFINYWGTFLLENNPSFVAFKKLISLREIYNDCVQSNYKDPNTVKYCIYMDGEVPARINQKTSRRVLSFRTPELRDMFMERFYDLIIEAKEFL